MRLATLSRELDTSALSCVDTEASSCEPIHSTRALVSLFENREAARASFRRVIALNPSSDLAASSTLWQHVIEDEATGMSSSDEPLTPLKEITAQLVRDWLGRQLVEYTAQGKTDALKNAQDSSVDQSEALQVLQKQVRERDRRIAILRSQLDALKLIDQDHQDRKRPLKTPATLLPMMDSQ